MHKKDLSSAHVFEGGCVKSQNVGHGDSDFLFFHTAEEPPSKT